MSDAAATELLRDLARAFERAELRWYVFGAQAVVAHGQPRLTSDVDAAVEARDQTPGELAAYLAGHGLSLRFPLGAREASARLLPLRHMPTDMPLDLVITGPGLDEELLERTQPIDLGGVTVPVISPEDLIAMKVLAGRRKDLADVRGVLLQQSSLDMARIEDVLAAFEEATDNRKLRKRLQRQLRAVQSKR